MLVSAACTECGMEAVEGSFEFDSLVSVRTFGIVFELSCWEMVGEVSDI